jgi:hypothetical protein
LVIVISATGATGVVRLVELFVVTGSKVGDVTDALFTIDVVIRGSTVPAMLTVVVAPATSVAMVHEADANVHVPLGEVMVVAVNPAGRSSATTRETASDGPGLVIVNRYVPDWPGTRGDGVDDFAIDRFARGVSDVVTDGPLLVRSGSGVAEPTVAVFVTALVELEAMPALMVKVADAPTARDASEQFTVVPRVHDPDETEADVAVSPAGITSVTVTVVATDGPSLVTTMAYDTG